MPPVDQRQQRPRPHTTFEALTTFMVSRPELASTLMREHANDGSNHCRLCSTGGQAGRHIWPCLIYRAADRAAAFSAL